MWQCLNYLFFREFGDINVARTPREIKVAEIQKDLLYIEDQDVGSYVYQAEN